MGTFLFCYPALFASLSSLLFSSSIFNTERCTAAPGTLCAPLAFPAVNRKLVLLVKSLKNVPLFIVKARHCARVYAHARARSQVVDKRQSG